MAASRVERLLARGRVRVPRLRAARRDEPPRARRAVGARGARVDLPEGHRDAGRRAVAEDGAREAPGDHRSPLRLGRASPYRFRRAGDREQSGARGAAGRSVPRVDRDRRQRRHDRRRARRHGAEAQDAPRRRRRRDVPGVDGAAREARARRRRGGGAARSRRVRGGARGRRLDDAARAAAASLRGRGAQARGRDRQVREGAVRGRGGCKGRSRRYAVGAIALLGSILFVVVRGGRLDTELASLLGLEPTFLPWHVAVGMVVVGGVLGATAALTSLRKLVAV